MKFKIFGTKVYISFIAIAFISFLIASDKTGYILPMLLAAFIHEAGHLFFMWMFDYQPKEVNVIPGSIQIVKQVSNDVKKDILISFSGPLVNLLLFTVLFINCKLFSDNSFLEFAIINLIYGLFNLIPVKCLDGGEILENFLLYKTTYSNAQRILRGVTIFFSIAVFIIGLLFTLKGETNYSVYIIGIYLLMSVLFKF